MIQKAGAMHLWKFHWLVKQEITVYDREAMQFIVDVLEQCSPE